MFVLLRVLVVFEACDGGVCLIHYCGHVRCKKVVVVEVVVIGYDICEGV